MANIGTFTKAATGFTGTIRTLALSVKANIVPDEHKASEAALDYRVFSGTVELGTDRLTITKMGGHALVTTSEHATAVAQCAPGLGSKVSSTLSPPEYRSIPGT